MLARDNIIEEQHKDAVWGPILRFINNEADDEEIPKWAVNADFFVEEGLLRKRAVMRRPDKTFEVVIIPKSLQEYALVLAHDSELGGHQGNVRTWKKACGRFFWINMLNDINKYIKTCESCQRRKVHGRIFPVMGEFPEVTRPLERVGVDLTELAVSSKGYRYILTIVDHLTKYLAAYPLRTKSTEEVTKRFVQYVTTYGAIENLVSDRGTEVTSTLFQEVCKRLGTVSRTTSAFRPQGNGQVEVMNKILKYTLSQLAGTDRLSWEDSLPFATLAINTSFHTVVENTPFYLFFGRDAHFPFSDAFKPPRVDYTLGKNYAAEMTARMHLAFQTVRDNMKKAHDKAAHLHDKKVNSDDVQVGMMVWVRNERQDVDQPNEWPTKYIGPYRVLEKNKTNARIRHVYKKSREEYVHLSRLKLAHLRDDPFPIAHDDGQPQEPPQAEPQAAAETAVEEPDATPDDRKKRKTAIPTKEYNLRRR